LNKFTDRITERMHKTRLLFFTGLLFFFSFLLNAAASGPVFWRINTRAEIEKGDAKGVAIADNGTLTLAPQFNEVFDTKQAYIWSAVADGRGNLYLGTGHEGRVFKVDAAGKGALLYKTGELDVMALAVDAQGNVYAGTAPDGKIYRITPSGEAKVFFEPKTKYIWSLAFDAQGRLYVGTGDKGIIFRVPPDGRGEAFVNTTQTNITSLRVDAAGNLIAGTDPGGLVLRIAPDAKAYALFDSSQREIRDLALGRNGEIYALALSEAAGSGATNTASATPSTAPSVSSGDEGGVTITISDVQVLDSGSTSTASTTSGSSGSQAKAALYRLDANGGSDVLWESKDAVAFAVSLDASDEKRAALVGTGQKGRVYLVTPSRKPVMYAQLPEAQVSRLLQVGKDVYAVTSNLGKLYRANAPSVSGSYTSSVREAATGASWGRVAWLGEGEVELQTRSGNTATPDSTWSDWSAPITNPEGDVIKSPASRFIQWRATLKRAAGKPEPSLREVTVSYLPRNVAPRINSITVLPVGVALQALPQQPMDSSAELAGLDSSVLGNVAIIPPRRTFQRGAISLQWQAEDRNGDSLEYSVYYRNALGGEFYLLKTDLRENYFTLDANALPDGRYVFKVVASDASLNPGNLALSAEQETEPLEIDNTPPTVAADAPRVQGRRAEVIFRASDATSIIRRAEFQLDGGAWQAVYPTDGIADARREEFRVSVTLPDARPHILAFRVFDANANIGATQVGLKGQ
jgi:sugar lactone lactonase YvrE